MTIHHGSCLCQAVKYELTDDAFRKVLCHCTECKKATGSAFMANNWYQKDQLRVISGQENLQSYKYHSTESGVTLDRSFCSTCGSPLFVTNSKSADAIIVTTGTMDMDELLHGWKPEMEYHCRRRRDWVDHLGDTKKLETM